MEKIQSFAEEGSEEKLNQVKQNNKKIKAIINEIIELRRNSGISLQNGNDIEEIAKSIFNLEVEKCIAIYKAEYTQYGFSESRGPNEAFIISKKGDCTGGTKGLGIGENMASFLDEVYGLLEKFNVQKSGAKTSESYDGSEKDQMDYLLHLKETNGIDMDFVLGILAHEVKHIYGVVGGNAFIKEGITEQTTREDCDKYGMYLSPTSHTQEANFIKKLELIVGRDEVINAGLYDDHIKYKENEFRKLADEDKSVTVDELNEFFELSRRNASKIDKKGKEKLANFRKNHSELLERIDNIGKKYDTMNNDDRYTSISKKFNEFIPDVDFKKLIGKLNLLYAIQIKHKQEPNFYRDLYSKNWNEIEGFDDDDWKVLSGSDDEFDKSEGIDLLGNGKKIKSFNDLISPINEYLEKNPGITTPSKIPNLEEVINFQNYELAQLEILRNQQRQIVSGNNEKNVAISKKDMIPIAKQEDVVLELADALEDMENLEKVPEDEKGKDSQSVE